MTVDYSFVPGSPRPAVAGDDYEAVLPTDLNGATLSFPDGVTVQTVTVSLLHDEVIEEEEELRLVLSNPSQAVLFDRDPDNSIDDEPYGVGTITDVDPPWLTVDNVAQDEGLTLEFTVTVCNRRAATR